MSVFAEYSRYYDLLYRDKNYRGEAGFVSDLIRIHAPQASSVLELGCGTGRHAELLAADGFIVHGIDRSEGMLAKARKRRGGLSDELADRLEFSAGDVRTVRLGKKFDVVISLFHVMSYMSTNQDLSLFFASAREHLVPGGLFLFDFWYGPAVLSTPPAVSIKRLADEQVAITRIAEPTLFPNENCVTVQYEIITQNKIGDVFHKFSESHKMRYLFLPEIDLLFAANGMRRVTACGWLTSNMPGIDTWSVCAAGIAAE